MFRRFLGLDRSNPDPRLPVGDVAAPLPDSAAETATARRIVARLEALPAEEARYLACFSYVMSRAANADFHISDDENRLGRVEPPVLDQEPLHDRGLLGADVEVGIRGTAHDVAKAGEIARLGGGQRFEPGNDPARRRRLGRGFRNGLGVVADG